MRWRLTAILVVLCSIGAGWLWNLRSKDASYYVSDRFKDSYNPEYDPESQYLPYERHIEQFRPYGVWQSPLQTKIYRNFSEVLRTTKVNVSPYKTKQTLHTHKIIIGNARFTFLTSQIVRMEWEKDGKFINQPSLVFSEREVFLTQTESSPPQISIFQSTESNGEVLCLQTDSLLLKYGNIDRLKDSEFLSYIESPPLTNETISIVQLETNRIWRPGFSDRSNLGGTVRTLDHSNGRVPLERGLLSANGWSFVDDSYTPLLRQGNRDSIKFPFAEERVPTNNQTDWYLFGCGLQFRSCLRQYTEIAGKIPLPPKYAFGIWWSRWWPYSDKQLKSLIDEFTHFGVPLDNLVIDMDWHLTSYNAMDLGAFDQSGQPLGWTGYTWDHQYFPKPEEFLAWCHAQGLHVTLNLHPAGGIQPHEEQYERVAKRIGIDPTSRNYVPLNITDELFTEVYFEEVIEPLENQGIDFWWLDYQQIPFTDILQLNPTIWLNHLFFNHMEQKKVSKSQNEDSRMQRGLIFHRWGGLGSHRYQIGFSGDTTSSWETLSFQVGFTATASNVAFSYWSHDIGGFMSNRPTDPELFTRWVQWGALSPIFRTHAWRQEFLERRIWAYPPYQFLAMREAIYFRYSLMPFLYTLARGSYDTGVGMFYPMYYDSPRDSDAYHFSEQGMLGDSLVLAPVCSPASSDSVLSTKSIYLPQNEIWIEWFSLTAISSGHHTRFIALDDIPLYIKQGSIIPMNKILPQDEVLLNLQKNLHNDPLVIAVFPGPSAASGNFTLYEDDGISKDYQTTGDGANSYARTHILSKRQKENGWEIEILPTEGSYYGMPQERSYFIKLVGVPPPVKVLLQGKEIVGDTNREQEILYEEYYYWSSPRGSNEWKESIVYNDKTENSYWMYDAFRMTLVIRVKEMSNSEGKKIDIAFSDLEDSLELLHGGIVGKLRKVYRIVRYSQEDISDLAKDIYDVPARIQSNLAQWKQHVQAFQPLYEKFIFDIENLPLTSESPPSRNTCINHLRTQ